MFDLLDQRLTISKSRPLGTLLFGRLEAPGPATALGVCVLLRKRTANSKRRIARKTSQDT